MGNYGTVAKEESKRMIFEENKKEYFTYVRKNFDENIKEIVTKLNSPTNKNKNNFSFNLNENSTEKETWQAYLTSKLLNYKTRMNQNTVRYVDEVISYIEKLSDANENHVLSMKLFLSNEMDETRNKVFLMAKEEQKCNTISPTKNAIIQRSIEYIFENLDCLDHPLNKVIKSMLFNFSAKYEKELCELEKKENERKMFEMSRKLTVSSQTSLRSTETSRTRSVCRNISNISEDELSKFYVYVKEELSNISFILILTLIKFYNVIEEPEYKIIDLIGEKIKDMLISGEILRFLQKVKYELKKDIILKYNEKFLEYYNILPQDLGISPYFSFDTQFRELITNKSNCENLVEEVEYPNLPYFKSIIYFKEINKVHSIIQKLEIMINLREIILLEIDSFWKGIPINQKKRYVDADNLLSIFIYLIVKSQIADLIVDIEIIEDFINRSLKLSRKGKIYINIGYFFSLVQSSFEYLLNTLNISQGFRKTFQ